MPHPLTSLPASPLARLCVVIFGRQMHPVPFILTQQLLCSDFCSSGGASCLTKYLGSAALATNFQRSHARGGGQFEENANKRLRFIHAS